ncbi:hypothetical protein ACQKJ1_26415 [Methylorubrum rhodesianum]|uniref:hypothetical protein n=1 Tax=Methylorubrum rhodesianum TaxID=29427 RepID=UPI003CFF7C25
MTLMSDAEGIGRLDPLPAKHEPTIEVDFRVGGVTALKAGMKAAEVEQARAACQAADDGWRVDG